MDRGGDELLARTRLAMNQDGRPATRHLRNVLHETLHGRVLADDAVELETLVDPRAQLSGLPAQTRTLERAVDDGDDGIELEGLGQIALRTKLDRLDRRIDRRERGHDDERRVRRHRTPALDQGQPVHPGHFEVGQHHVRLDLLDLQDRGPTVCGGAHRVAGVVQKLGEGVPRVGLVVDDKNSSLVAGRAARLGLDRRVRRCRCGCHYTLSVTVFLPTSGV